MQQQQQQQLFPVTVRESASQKLFQAYQYFEMRVYQADMNESATRASGVITAIRNLYALGELFSPHGVFLLHFSLVTDTNVNKKNGKHYANTTRIDTHGANITYIYIYKKSIQRDSQKKKLVKKNSRRMQDVLKKKHKYRPSVFSRSTSLKSIFRKTKSCRSTITLN